MAGFLDRLTGYLLAHPVRYWATAAALTALASAAALGLAVRAAESERSYALDGEVNRIAVEIMGKTMGGKFMGSLGYYGLTYQLAKDVAINKLSASSMPVLESLKHLGQESGAEGCFIVDKSGIVESSWDKDGKSATGIDVRFRPYFQRAMDGQESIYAAVSVNTGRRALYYAAPIYAFETKSSPVIGAAAIRLGLERIDEMLTAWKGGVALLLTPNKVVFASTHPDWAFSMASEAGQEALEKIRKSKQFGKLFDGTDPRLLPFSLDSQYIELSGRKFALDSAPVVWNDPQGDWTLVLLDDLSNAVSPVKKAVLAAVTGAFSLLVFFVILVLLRNREIKARAKAAEELAAKRLRESEANLRRILEASPIPIVISRLSDESILMANERAGQYFGLPPAELLSRQTGSFYADPGERLEVIGALDEAGRVKDRELILRRADGSEFVALMSLELIELSGDEVVIAGLLDITERKRAEEAVREANENLREAMEVIASSIRYASRIQRSVLPEQSLIAARTAENFVIWNPRDVVGGDIYWYREWGGGFVVILADCTGHGVPGAFMTLIAGGALDMSLRRVPPGDPAALIRDMHTRVRRVLGQHIDGGSADDGLELGVCYFTANPDIIVYAGAHFPLFYTDGGKVEVVKGDKTGIGYQGLNDAVSFSNRIVPVTPGRRFYLATDGLFDQIGEATGRPFGKKRFTALLAELDSVAFEQHAAAIEKRFVEHQGSQSRRDDVAVIGFHFGGRHDLV